MKIILMLLFIFITACSTTKQSEQDRSILLAPTNTEDINANDLNRYPEIYLSDESSIENYDSNIGVTNDAFYTAEDDSRIGLAYGLSSDFDNPGKIQSFEFNFHRKLTNSYKNSWWTLSIKQVDAKYSALAVERATTDGTPRLDNKQVLSILGLGLSYRFKALALTSVSERFFERINVYANYVRHGDSTDTKNYTGYGYTAEYELEYRSGKRLFYMTKLSYNWALVDRPREDQESLEARSLTFGWLSLGLGLGIYF